MTGAEETMMLGTTSPLINPLPQDTPMIPMEQGHLTSSMTPSLDKPRMSDSSTPDNTMKIKKLFTSALTTPTTHYMKTMPSISRDGRNSGRWNASTTETLTNIQQEMAHGNQNLETLLGYWHLG
jgi:hypothetical protein